MPLQIYVPFSPLGRPAADRGKRVRHCLACDKDVFLVQSQAEWDLRAAAGACVAVELHQRMIMGEPRTNYKFPQGGKWARKN